MDDIKEIKTDVKELLQRSAIHNTLLAEHKNYSLALQHEQNLIKEQIKPIEKHVALVTLILKGVAAISIGALIQLVIHLLFK